MAAQQRLFLRHRSGRRLLQDLRVRITQALDGEVWSPPEVRGARLFATYQAGSADHPRLLVLWFHRVGSPAAGDQSVLGASTNDAALSTARLHHGRWPVAEHSYGEWAVSGSVAGRPRRAG
ncbi:MAG: hypothetical protein JO268_03345 [Pseudonocardiales bacterium]|nr:hypothetical protein [Pseudonocardiales bacterium]